MSFYYEWDTGTFTDRQGYNKSRYSRQARLTQPGSGDTGCCQNNIKTKLANSEQSTVVH